MNIDINDTDIQKSINAVKDIVAGRNMHACVITFGCQQNEADSEKIRAITNLMGYSQTAAPEKADLIIVNTCAIRKHAELKALSLLGNFKALKKNNPELIIGVAGCMAAEPQIADMLKNKFKYVSFSVEPNMLRRLPELVRTNLCENKRSFVFDCDDGSITEGIEPVRMSEHKAWVSIMYGCNNFCSYCIVPYVRGRERSRDSATIIDECKKLVECGYKEITLLGQNVNSYRSDMDFATLLENIAGIQGDFTVRFMTSHPKDVPDSLIDVMKKHTDKIAPCFHLPLQSGSDRILKAMNRTYNAERFLSTVNKLRCAIPDIAITTDIIIGFPGETEEDFQQTLNMLSEIKFDMVYSFLYSLRDGTRAALMDNQVPDNVKSSRMAKLLELQREISEEKNKPYVNTVQRVLVDSVSEKNGEEIYSARTATNKLVHFKSEKNCIGEYKYVKIDRAGPYDLFAERIIEKQRN